MFVMSLLTSDKTPIIITHYMLGNCFDTDRKIYQMFMLRLCSPSSVRDVCL